MTIRIPALYKNIRQVKPMVSNQARRKTELVFLLITKRLAAKTKYTVCSHKIPNDKECIDECADINTTGLSEEVC